MTDAGARRCLSSHRFTTLFRRLLVSLSAIALLPIAATAQSTIATFEFTGGALTPTLGTFATDNSITVSDLSTFSAPAAASIADLVSDADAMRIPGDLTAGGSGSAISGGQFLSFDVTIPDTVTLNLTALSADISGTNTFSYSSSRLLSSIHGDPSTFDATADTIGANFSAHPSISLTTLTNNLSNPTANVNNGANVNPGDFASLSDTTVTFYLPWIDGSSSASRWATLDNLTLTGEISGAPELSLTVDRDSGEITLNNPGNAGGQDFIGYSITSSYGSLDAGAWTSIADTYDATGSGSPTISADEWTELTGGNPEAPKNGDLSEFDFASSAGATMPASTGVSLGVGAWIASDVEDLDFTYVLPDGTEVDGIVNYVGNGGLSFATGDFDTDGDIDEFDWDALRTNLGGDFPSDSQAESYSRGDLNGDLDVDAFDFVNFRSAYDAANGEGAFAAMVATPEPSSVAIVLVGGALACCRRRRLGDRRHYQRIPAVLACLIVMGAAANSSAQFLTNADFEATPFDTDWDNTSTTPATSTAGIAPGSTTAALIPGADAGTSLFQQTTDPSEFMQDFAIDFYFEIDAFAAVNRSLNVQLRYAGDESGEAVNARVNPSGDLQLFTGSSWETVGGAAAAFAPDNVYRLQFTGQGWGDGFGETSLGVSWSDAGSDVFSNVGDLSGLVNDGFRFEPSGFTSEGVERAFSEIRFLSAFQDAGDPSFIVDDLSLSAIDPLALTLEVDPVDGDTRIVNNTSATFNIDLYQITSALDELDADGWSSLEEQDLSGFPAGDGTGNGWEAGDASDADTLIEAFLTGDSTIGPGASIYLGQAVSPGVTQVDNLSWNYHTAGTGTTLISGPVSFVNVEAPVGQPGDFNGDGLVDAADYAVWRNNLGSSFDLGGNGDESGGSAGVVDVADYDLWRANYGAGSGGGSGAVVGVPEPAAVLLALLGTLALMLRRRAPLAAVAAIAVVGLGVVDSAEAITIDREYLLGETESASAGSPVGNLSFDAQTDFVDLGGPGGGGGGDPQYVSTSDRPGATGSSIGISFDGDGDFLQTFSFGNPETSRKAIGWDEVTSGIPDLASPRNYTGIRNRGLQLWIKPTDDAASKTAVQQVIADTTQFGVLISDDTAGNPTWVLDSADGLVDTGVEVAFDSWTHVAVVRQFNVGTTMYINGRAVSRTGSDYDTNDTSRLVIGGFTSGDLVAFGGSGDHFNGVVDDVELFTWGTSDTGPGSEPGVDFGDFNFATANSFAMLPNAVGGLSGVAGDVDNDGVLEPVDDVNAFLAGWQNSNFVPFAPGLGGEGSTVPVADLTSYENGDLNLDGRTDISDAILLHQALVASGSGSLDFSLLEGGVVPEPQSLALVIAATAGLVRRRRRR